MADSDDEYDRKRRDKFRGERSGDGGSGANGGGNNGGSSGSYRGGGGDRRCDERGRGREDWNERYVPFIKPVCAVQGLRPVGALNVYG